MQTKLLDFHSKYFSFLITFQRNIAFFALGLGLTIRFACKYFLATDYFSSNKTLIDQFKIFKKKISKHTNKK